MGYAFSSVFRTSFLAPFISVTPFFSEQGKV